MLDETIRTNPDPLSKRFGNNRLNPYWTGYSYTLQEQLDNITLGKYTDIVLEKSFNTPDQMSAFDIQALLFYEMCCLLGFALLYIFQVIFLV